MTRPKRRRVVALLRGAVAGEANSIALQGTTPPVGLGCGPPAGALPGAPHQTEHLTDCEGVLDPVVESCQAAISSESSSPSGVQPTKDTEGKVTL